MTAQLDSIAPPTGEPVREPPAPRRTSDIDRLVGPDVVRAVALIGVVVMNYHGYLIINGGEEGQNFWGRVFNPWTGPLSTRFAATFVLTAGVGVTLLTRNAVGKPAAVAAKRWTLIRRGLLLYGFGLIFYDIWPGSILPYYGAMFVVAAGLFTFATPWIIAIGGSAALAGAGIAWWGNERTMDGQTPSWLYNPPNGSPRGLLFDMFVNGTHPLFPWLAFLCAGIVLGRVLRTDWWRPVAIGLGLTLFGVATFVSGGLEDGSQLTTALTSTDSRSRSLVYTASALGTALVGFTVIYTAANRFRNASLVKWIARAGQMTLTIYIAHALVFNYIVDWQGWVEPSGLDLALTFAAIFWIIAIAVASVWQRRFHVGPAEWVYRKIGG